MKCMIIDDEYMAIEVLAGYAKKVPFLTLVAQFTDAIQAIDFLHKNEVDLLLLDINMPDITGMQLLDSLPHPPMVIFTTAYASYAIDSYNYETVDFLLKPILFGRFLKAVTKAHALHQMRLPANDRILQIKSGTALHRVKEADVLYLEGTGNYVKFITASETIMGLLTMQQAFEMLSAERFLRVHKSYIVAIPHIKIVEKASLKVGTAEIPIGSTYRESVAQRLGS